MTYSLRRVLAVRFSLTMFIALTIIACWAMIVGERSIQQAVGSAPLSLATANSRLVFVMLGTVLLGTIATAFGAYWLARSAVQPVNEVAEQARRLPPDVRGGRITAHADVAEYASLVSVLNGLLERADNAFASQRRFIADVSHELRTPLTALQGHLEVSLRSDRSPRDYQVVIAGALEETQHLARMCDSLLLITRAESGEIMPAHTHVDLQGLTNAVLDRHHRRVEEKGLVLVPQFEYTGPAPELDLKLVERAVIELVDNGIKFSPRGGRLAVGTRGVAGGVEWWIEDQGPGIRPADIPRLFEPFYRVDPARNRDGGTGLGLTLAASIARLHRGTVRAEALPGDGARFVLFFPAAAQAA